MFLAETNGIKMEYIKFGLGVKTIVILPGLSVKSVMQSEDAVAQAYSVFSDDYTVYLFDTRLDMPKNYSIKMMADDTAEIMKYLGLNNVYLFGASQGGMIAQFIAVYFPELVKCMVLGSTACSIPSGSIINDWIKLSEEEDQTILIRSMISSIYSERTVSEFGKNIEKLMLPITEDELLRFRTCANAIIGFDIFGEIEKIKCPVLAIASNGDKLIDPAQSELIAEKTSGKFFTYDNSYGHAVYDEAPDYKDRIKSFFEEY